MQAAIDSAIPPPAAAPGRGRIPQVDYLKGILITLMVLFHLSWFSTHYLDVTRYVYVFHMSGFIILSGFFANTGKTPGQFLKTWLGILAPYLVFESLYYLALSHLPASVPASNRLDPAFPAFWKALLLAPAGTYWYLYLLAVCLPVYYAVSRIPRLSPPARLAVCAALLAAVSWFNPAFQMIHAAYFLLGAFFRMTGLPILKCFFPTLWAAVPAAALCLLFPLPSRDSMLGLCLCMLTLSFLVKTCDSAGRAIRELFAYLGRNSLSIVIFSPAFTLLCKPLVPVLAFDSSRICFADLSVALVLAACLGVTRLCDALGWSRFLFLKKKMYSPLALSVEPAAPLTFPS